MSEQFPQSKKEDREIPQQHDRPHIETHRTKEGVYQEYSGRFEDIERYKDLLVDAEINIQFSSDALTRAQDALDRYVADLETLRGGGGDSVRLVEMLIPHLRERVRMQTDALAGARLKHALIANKLQYLAGQDAVEGSVLHWFSSDTEQ